MGRRIAQSEGVKKKKSPSKRGDVLKTWHDGTQTV